MQKRYIYVDMISYIFKDPKKIFAIQTSGCEINQLGGMRRWAELFYKFFLDLNTWNTQHNM